MSSAWDQQETPGSDPWSINAFDPPRPKVNPPASRMRQPRVVKPIPSQHELYVVQRHALDVLHDLREVEHLVDLKDRKLVQAIQRLERDAENTYRVIRTWLEEHTDGA
jgi:hypothetical protein